MTKLRVHNVTVSLDGYGAGPSQSLENPLGIGGPNLHGWAFESAKFRRLLGMEGGGESVNDPFIMAGVEGIGATIMGRNMFGPVRGPWPDESWTGWWGDTPPYHHPVFVLTHHARESFALLGGTTFHFVTGGIHEALERATEAADGLDIRLGGGMDAIRQYVRAGLVDELHIAVSPILLGDGERLLDRLGDAHAMTVDDVVANPGVTHYRLVRAG